MRHREITHFWKFLMDTCTQPKSWTKFSTAPFQTLKQLKMLDLWNNPNPLWCEHIFAHPIQSHYQNHPMCVVFPFWVFSNSQKGHWIQSEMNPFSSEATSEGHRSKAPTLMCCAVGGNWKAQKAHEILREEGMVGLIRRRGRNYQW